MSRRQDAGTGQEQDSVETLCRLVRETHEMARQALRRAEQAVTVSVHLRNDFDDRWQTMLGLRPRTKVMPMATDGPAVRKALEDLEAAVTAKEQILVGRLRGLSDEVPGGKQPLDLDALDRADAAIEQAKAAYSTAMAQAPPVIDPAAPEVPKPQLVREDKTKALAEVLERAYRYMMQGTVPRERWNDLVEMTDLQKSAIWELYLEAVQASDGSDERGFALFVKWCELNALDERADPMEKSPRHLFCSPELHPVNVDLGPTDTWWTADRVMEAWLKQIAVV